MELSLRLDTLGVVEMRYLKGRERYRDWPPFLLLAASRQARVLAYLTREAVEELHQQILAVESATGLGIDTEDDDDDDDDDEESSDSDDHPNGETSNASLSPAFAQALERLNELARQRLPEGGSGSESSSDSLPAFSGDEEGLDVSDEDALELLQDAFVQMMEVVRELAEEMATDALKLTGRLRCTRTEIFFTQAEPVRDDEEDEDEDEEDTEDEDHIELALILRLYEEGRSKPDDLPAIELQLDVDDFERLHETIDLAVDRERRSRRRR